MASLFMDASSELIHSLLPVFMSSVLGTSIVTIGFVEGIAEATAAITKVFSGTLSDYAGRRKPLMVFGYGLAAATKPMFPLASSLTWVFLGRFIDRIGKGIRGAPRDALVADVTPPALRGTAYGLRQALDSVGAFVGPLLAVLLMRWFADDIRTVLWFGVLPAFVAVALLVIFIREPERHSRPEQARAPGREPGRDSAGHPEQDDAAVRRAPSLFSLAMLQQLPLRYWLIVQLSALFTLARFSEAFLVLKVTDAGVGAALVPIVLVVMNVVYALSAYPAGYVSDHLGRWGVLAAVALAWPALGGVLYLLGAEVVFAVCLACSLAMAAAILAIRTRVTPITADQGVTAWSRALSGLAYVRRQPIIFGAITLDLFAVLLGGVTALLPIYAKDILVTGPWGLGLLRSAPAIGALGMSIVLAHVQMQHRIGHILFVTVAMFGVSSIAFAFSTYLVISMIALTVYGACDAISVVIRHSLVQTNTPHEMLGRVLAVNFMFTGTSGTLGEFRAGAVAAAFGAFTSVLVGGVGAVLVALLWMRLFPEIRRIDSLGPKH